MRKPAWRALEALRKAVLEPPLVSLREMSVIRSTAFRIASRAGQLYSVLPHQQSALSDLGTPSNPRLNQLGECHLGTFSLRRYAPPEFYRLRTFAKRMNGLC